MKSVGYCLFFCIAAIYGCSMKEVAEPSQTQKEWPQTCEMCGSEWLVSHVDSSSEPVPATVEWCFNDGQYCETGLEMIIAVSKHGKSDLSEQQWLEHCVKCSGCRCAAFSPKKWKEVTATSESVRAKGASK